MPPFGRLNHSPREGDTPHLRNMDHANRLAAADLAGRPAKASPVRPRAHWTTFVLRTPVFALGTAGGLMAGLDGADELVLETIAGAWSKERARPPQLDLVTWLFGLMHAAHRRDLRWHAKGRQPTFAGEEQLSRRSAASSEGVATADMCTRVLRLPIEEREVLMLVAVERLSYADIASLLGVPMATVLSTLARARARLADSSRMT